MRNKLIFILAATLLFTSCGDQGGLSNDVSSNSSDNSLSVESSNLLHNSSSLESSDSSETISSEESISSDSNSSSPEIEDISCTITINTTKGGSIAASSFTCKNGKFEFQSFNRAFTDNAQSVRLGSGSGKGEIIFSSSSSMYIKSITLDAEAYGSDFDVPMTVSLSNGESDEEKINARKEYVFSFAGSSKSSSFTISCPGDKKRGYLYNDIVISSQVVNGGNSSSSSESSSESNSSISSESSSSIDTSIDTGDISNSANDSYKGNYYSSINSSLTGDSLVKELGKLITHNGKKTYDDLWDAYKTTDVKPGTNICWDMYSNIEHKITSDHCGNYKVEGDCINREHSIPQSWFDKKSPMKSDVFHVYPTDGKVNGMRSNHPFGEVSSATFTSTNGSKLGTSSVSGISGTVFEPIDEYKGDFARTYFYMCTRYYSQVGTWSGGVFKGSYPYMNKAYFELYKKWALEDPVSQKEITRNEAAYAFQGNRNPYIDCPSLFYRAFC